MNILEFLVRDVNYVFNDVKTFARLRLACKLIRSLVDAADVRFIIIGKTSRTQVDVRGSKYYTIQSNIDNRIVVRYYTYTSCNGLTYKYEGVNVVAIFQTKNGKKHGYYCMVCGKCIYAIDQYDNGKLISATARQLIDGYYTDEDANIIHPKGYLSHWLHNVPLAPL
jgi:hypothetical protein